jgi:hypothetical protein
MPTVTAMARLDLGLTKRYGFKPSFNETYETPDSPSGWRVTPYHFGIDQGPVVLMIENYRTGRIWHVFMQHAAIQRGLERAGFAPVTPTEKGRSITHMPSRTPQPVVQPVHSDTPPPTPQPVIPPAQQRS